MGYIEKEVNEKYIKNLTILKLKRNYDFIEREEYKQELKALVESHEFSDYAELLSFTAFNVIFNRIEDMQDENVKVIFNEEVKALMDNIIENNIFENKKGTLVSRYSAQVTEKAVTEFTVE